MKSTSTATYIDTPYGILTASGRRYHVTEEDVEDYAGPVLEHVSLEQLLQWADVWLGSATTIALWALPLLLWGVSPTWGGASAVGLYVVWRAASPALPSLMGVRVLSWLDHVLVQGLYYVLVLSALAAAQQYLAVGIGLAGFVLLRWGLVQWAFGYLLNPLSRVLYPLPVADQVLRGLIVRVALKHRLSLPHLDEITRDILKNWGARSDSETSTSEST